MNELTVSGPEDKVTAFANDCKGKKDDGEETVLSFETVVPIPNWAEEEDWYLARCFLWGTKWDADETSIEEDDEWGDERIIKYGFATAWSPPCEFVLRASRTYPDVTINLTWDEPGMDFAGRMVVEGGEVVSHKELVEIPFDPVKGGMVLVNIDRSEKDVVAFLKKLDPTLEFPEPVREPTPLDEAPVLALAT